MTTRARVARRSFYPEQFLIDRREVDSLYAKYLARRGERVRALLDFSHVRLNTSPDLNDYDGRPKKIGSIFVAAPARANMRAHDERHNLRFRFATEVIGLHVGPFSGPQQLRTDMAQAATFINNLPSAAKRPEVAGLTFSEFGRLAVRHGFRELTLQDLPQGFEQALQTAHQIFCRFGNKPERPFVPVAVYMPTEEFIATFNPALRPASNPENPSTGQV